MQKIVLSSTSPARKILLERLKLPFVVAAPDVDETPLPNESAYRLVKRLAVAKARINANNFVDALIIGCDQVGVLKGRILTKPGTHAKAVEMLMQASGQRVTFYTGLCLLNTKTDSLQLAVERFDVVYRTFTLSMVENYLQKDQPYQCAGAIKAESLGSALFERIVGKDPSALTGLPLIRLVRMLEQEGVRIV